MEYTKLFKQVEKSKKILEKNAMEKVNESIKKYFSGFTLKQTGYFEYKVRFNTIDTPRNLFHLFISNGINYPCSDIFKFEKTKFLEDFNSNFSFKFDNLLISGNITFETMSEFNTTRIELEKELVSLMEYLRDVFGEYKKAIVSQIPLYLNYYSETNFGFNKLTFKEFLAKNTFLDGWAPFLCERYIKNSPNFTEKQSGTTLVKQQDNLLLVKKIWFTNNWRGNVEQIESIDLPPIEIDKMFDCDSGYTRVDKIHYNYKNSTELCYDIDFGKSPYGVFHEKVKKNYWGEYKVPEALYEYEKIFSSLLSIKIAELNYPPHGKKQRYFEEDEKQLFVFKDKRLKCKRIDNSASSTYDYIYVDNFNFDFIPQNINQMFNSWETLMFTKLSFLRQFHPETLEHMDPFYWQTDMVYNRKINPVFFRINPIFLEKDKQ